MTIVQAQKARATVMMCHLNTVRRHSAFFFFGRTATKLSASICLFQSAWCECAHAACEEYVDARAAVSRIGGSSRN